MRAGGRRNHPFNARGAYALPRHIAVLSRAFDVYAPTLEIVFERYGVPAFFSRKTDILAKPVVSSLLSAIEAIQSDFTHETLFRYLKTGLSGISSNDVDLLENYVLTWGSRESSGPPTQTGK